MRRRGGNVEKEGITTQKTLEKIYKEPILS